MFKNSHSCLKLVQYFLNNKKEKGDKVTYGRLFKKVYIQAKWSIGPELIPVSAVLKRLRLFQLPSGWDSSPPQATLTLNPPAPICTPTAVGGERQTKLSRQRTQRNMPGQGSNLDCLFWR